MYATGLIHTYNQTFAGQTEASGGTERLSPGSEYGPEDTLFVENLARMRPDQDAAVIDLANDLGYLTPADRPDVHKAGLAAGFISFLSEDGEPAVSDEILYLFTELAEAPDESYLDILDRANESGLCRDYAWAQRLISVLLFSSQSEQRRQYNSTVLSNAKNFFGAIKLFSEHRLAG